MISKKWVKISEAWLGNRYGKHCHWCTFINHDEGQSFCSKEGCKHNDRIRTWDGGIAITCKYFELKKWYTDDKNYDKYCGIKPKLHVGDKVFHKWETVSIGVVTEVTNDKIIIKYSNNVSSGFWQLNPNNVWLAEIA